MWKNIPLGEVCEILDKLRKPITKKHRTDGNIPYYGATGIVDWVENFIFDEKLVLVGEDGAKWDTGENTAFIVDGKTWVNNHAHVLRPISDVVTHEWLAYYLTSIDLSPWVTGLTVPKLNQAQLRSIPIPIPPLAEQQRIVAKLDAAFAEIDRVIELAEVKNAEVEKLKANVLKNLLSGGDWQTVKLGEVIEKTETVNPSSKFPNDSFEYIDVSSVNKKRLAIEETQTLLGKDAPSRARRRVHEYDVIFATVRPTLKRIAVVPNVLDGQICSTGYIVLRGKKDVLLPRYLFYWMTSQFVMEYVESVQTGASYPAVTDKQVKEIDIPLPPLAEQQRIVAKLDAAYAEIDIAKKSVVTVKTNYAALKSAILAQELNPSEAA